jgi:hypothetical protein
MAQQPATTTSTGWRLVGEAATLLSSPTLLDAAPPPSDDDVVFAAQFRVKPRLGNPDDAAVAAIAKAIAGARATESVLGKATKFTEPASKFHALAWDTAGGSDRWTAELLWRRVHPAIAGLAITDHVVLDRRHAEATLTVRTWSPGGMPAVRGHVGAGLARSPVLPELAHALRLSFDNHVAEPRPLGESDIEAFVRDVLLDDDRRWPVAVLAPTEDGGYHVDPTILAGELLGLAHVYYIDRHPTTFRLSDTLGDRRLSCYWGALRVYQPGFSCADDGRSHPLLVDDRVLDPVERAGLAGTLALANRARITVPDTPSRLRELAEPKKPARVAEPAAVPFVGNGKTDGAPAPLPSGFDRAMSAIADALRSLQESNARLIDEVIRLRSAAAVRAANSGGLERRVSQLERTMRERLPLQAAATDAPVETPTPTETGPEIASDITLVSVVQQASAVQGDALLLLDSAIRSAGESPYEDVNRVALILETMGQIARQRRDGKLGTSLRDIFREYGIDYRGGIAKSTPPRLLEQYRHWLPSGQEVICDEHIALGTSYDPRHCLRIYFTSRAPGEPRFIISHVGRHFDVATTT